MSAYTFLLLVALACAAQGAILPQIIGGRYAQERMYLYQVSLRWNGTHFCGGSIIGKRTIMTAARCLKGRENELKSLTIHVGTYYQKQEGTVYTTSNVTIHQNYDATRFTNDIALIHSDKDIQFNNKVQAIKLTSKDVDEGLCKLTGWGATKLGGETPDHLQELDLYMQPFKICRVEEIRLIDSHLCTNNNEVQGACEGDYGSPLVINLHTGGNQIGIFSFDGTCEVEKWHRGSDVYTRVYSFLDWIAENRRD